ncbi:hypothetical protein [Rurimicrobium arvi]|uniref:Uncharacterized protein n=1 Tax=Rurimicrobium arvi TaxID=2049916 RepID=A0ABP8MYW5_9BACT
MSRPFDGETIFCGDTPHLISLARLSTKTDYLKNNPQERLHTDPCAPAGGLAFADQQKTQSQPCSAFAGTPESSPYPCGELAGTPETFPHPCGSFAGTPDCFLHPCGDLAGTPDTLPHPCGGFAGKTN